MMLLRPRVFEDARGFFMETYHQADFAAIGLSLAFVQDNQSRSVHGTLLSEASRMQIYIPAGFAHGFYVTSEVAGLAYKCTDFYDPGLERTLLWNDPDLDIRLARSRSIAVRKRCRRQASS